LLDFGQPCMIPGIAGIDAHRALRASKRIGAIEKISHGQSRDRITRGGQGKDRQKCGDALTGCTRWTQVFIIYGIMQRSLIGGLSIFLSVLLAAPPAIGVATSSGSFQVNHAQVSGNSTVFDGASVETTEATSRVRLNGGAWIELAPESKA